MCGSKKKLLLSYCALQGSFHPLGAEEAIFLRGTKDPGPHSKHVSVPYKLFWIMIPSHDILMCRFV